MSTTTTPPLEGIVPPLVTPLAGPDRLDIAGLERLIEHVLGGGVHGLFILGTTGEGASLSYRLRRELISNTCRLVAGSVPVLVGITDTCLAEAAALAGHAADAGAQAVVTSTPYYFAPEQTELIAFIRRLVEQLPLPLYLYNMPMLTKTQFDPETVRQLLQIDRVIGLKDSSGDLNYFRQVVAVGKTRPDWRLFIGPEQLLVEALRLGGHGGVSGGAQIDPKLLVGLYEATRSAEVTRVNALQKRLSELSRIYLDGRYASKVIKGTKCALSFLGICKDEPAPPLLRLTPAERQQVRTVLEELDLLPASAAKTAEVPE
jgi:dihydrodipicolinate synthase/N-acetylneuraminate lyase